MFAKKTNNTQRQGSMKVSTCTSEVTAKLITLRFQGNLKLGEIHRIKHALARMQHDPEDWRLERASKTDQSVRISYFTSQSYLHQNQISKIEGLEACVNLVNLNLAHNRIKKIEGLEYCVKLKNLDLSNNMIETLEDLEGLRDIPNLSSLDLRTN